MSEPNALDALATDNGDTPFTFTVKGVTGRIRKRKFGDLRAASHAEDELRMVMVLIERCGDEKALEILDDLDEDDAIEVYQRYQRHYGSPGN